MRARGVRAASLAAALLLAGASPASVLADAREDTLAACPPEALLEAAFANGARWTLCTELRARESLALVDVVYTPPGAEPLRVLASATLAQLHVAYDASDVTYADVTQHGLGGAALVALAASDCPAGELRAVNGRPLLCVTPRAGGAGHVGAGADGADGERLELLAVSQVGAYTYALAWTLGDDGSLAPAVGATGALQRSSAALDTPFGRVLAGEPATSWLAHTHTYHWRLDFDVGASASDDAVTETRHRLDPSGRRDAERERFVRERARRVEPDALQAWTVWERDDAIGGGGRGFRIEPLRHGQRFERGAIEPWSVYDLVVSVARDCERFASQNARFEPDCPDHVLAYADGESLAGEDLVLWYRVGFHHLPRNEDRRHMHTHWDGFRIEALNVHARSPALGDAAGNAAPVLGALATRRGAVGDAIDARLAARDADGDPLVYLAGGLPPGIALAVDGRLSGRLERAGEYSVSLRVDDGRDTVAGSFLWRVEPARASADRPPAADGGGGGRAAGGFVALAALALVLDARRRARAARRRPYTR